MDTQIETKNAHKKFQDSSIHSGTGKAGKRNITNVEVNSEYPLVSFITMIAPSHNWFVGVYNFNLCNTTSEEWLDSRAGNLPLYNAGTDCRPNFTSPNCTTIPQIHLITNNTEVFLNSDKPLEWFGTFTFKKTFDSNVNVTTTTRVTPPPSVTTSKRPTSSASSFKQFAFIHAVFALILVNLLL